MPEMHLRQHGFTYSACGQFTKNKERIQKFKEAGDSRHIYKLDKACFQHDMTYGGLKDLTRRTISDKIFPDKAFNIKCFIYIFFLCINIFDLSVIYIFLSKVLFYCIT